MTRACRRAAAAAVLLLLGTGIGRAADPTAAAFHAFGLLGVWARDCRQPPSRDNPRVSYDVPAAGPITHTVSFDGITVAQQDGAADATILSDELIRYSVIRGGAVTVIVTIRHRGGRMRTMDSVGADGTAYYANGIDLGTGHPSLEFERCAGAPYTS